MDRGGGWGPTYTRVRHGAGSGEECVGVSGVVVSSKLGSKPLLIQRDAMNLIKPIMSLVLQPPKSEYRKSKSRFYNVPRSRYGWGKTNGRLRSYDT